MGLPSGVFDKKNVVKIIRTLAGPRDNTSAGAASRADRPKQGDVLTS